MIGLVTMYRLTGEPGTTIVLADGKTVSPDANGRVRVPHGAVGALTQAGWEIDHSEPDQYSLRQGGAR